LGASVFEELLALCRSDELQGFDFLFGRTPVVRSPNPRTTGVRSESNAAHQWQVSRDRDSTGRDSGFALARAVQDAMAADQPLRLHAEGDEGREVDQPKQAQEQE
jgi:hypothetical protein